MRGITLENNGNIKEVEGVQKPHYQDAFMVQGEVNSEDMERLERSLITEVYKPLSLDEVRKRILHARTKM